MSDFVLQFPLFFLIAPSTSFYMPIGGTYREGYRAVSIFTERLFAERVIESDFPLGAVYEIDNVEKLRSNLEVFSALKATNVIIDPGTGSKLFKNFSIEEFRGKLEMP